MRLVFGLSLDRPGNLQEKQTSGGIFHAGPNRLLQILESYFGFGPASVDEDYLRIEQYRQILHADAEAYPLSFFQASFRVDPFATATELLSRRDELLLAGWDFLEKPEMPERLRTLARLKQRESALSSGFADRFHLIYGILDLRRFPFGMVQVLEPFPLLPPPWRRFFEALETRGVPVQYGDSDSPAIFPETDLGKFQALIQGEKTGKKQGFAGDGSLVILRGKRDTDLAAFFAAWARKNQDNDACLLLPDASGTLDNALVSEGMPSLGVQSASLARPALQVLKLIPVFLWNPLDPFKVLEFVSLALKPLEEELATRIARQMAQTPGIFSDSWQAMISQYFRELESIAPGSGRPDPDEIRRQYRFWFERRRNDSSGSAPKAEALEMYRYLSQWAFRLLEKGEGGSSLITLSTQARRIVELLDALPEDRLTRLELERIVRTIFEAAPLQLREQETGSFACFQHSGALDKAVDTLVWWNFSQGDPDFFFSRWSKQERAWLETTGVTLYSPEQQNMLLLWQRKRPILRTTRRLWLVQPEIVEGKAVQQHPLMGDLEAGFENLEPIIFDVDCPPAGESRLLKNIPDFDSLPLRAPGKPKPFLEIGNPEALQPREAETFSSLETLLYYPYQWVFRYKLQLRKSAILSIVDERTLFGNLAHRFFEKLLQQEDLLQWSKARIESFISQEAPALLSKEGSVLLLYGREPEKVQLLKKITYAAWSLVDLLQQNGWTAIATEMPLSGRFLDLDLAGRADLVLQRGEERAVIDLKWGGAGRREASIKNEEDLQLVLYTYLLQENEVPVHSAYFIMENGRMIARNQAAFKGINAVTPDADHGEVRERILKRMAATLHWRTGQLSQGKIEVRCAQTRFALERHYEESLLEILEMKIEDAPFDDYRVLINLVD